MATSDALPASQTLANPAASDPPHSKLAAKEKKSKAVKEKKTRAPRGTKPAAAHPPYQQMVKEAISSLKERSGSSQKAIAKYLEDQYKSALPGNFKKILSIQLKKLSEKGKLMRVKHSYKLSDALKKPAVRPTSVKTGLGAKRSAGRPKGSKNKPKPVSTPTVAVRASGTSKQSSKAVKAGRPVKTSKPATLKSRRPGAARTPRRATAPKKVVPKKPKTLKMTKSVKPAKAVSKKPVVKKAKK